MKNQESDQKPQKYATRESLGTLTSIIGIIVNFILAGIKFLAGLLSGSIAITADAVNNLSDSMSSGVSFVSFKISSKPADRDHPFGHARIEYIASMIVSFLILFVGGDFLIDSLKKIFNSSEAEIEIDAISITILSISILIKLGLSVYQRIMGKKINSGVILASSVDSLTDALSTLAVLVCSIMIKLTSLVIIDAIVGMLVSILIFVAGIRILNETKNSLLGEAPVEETVKAIEEIVAKYPEIIGMHDMLVHNYGPNHYFASFHAEVDGSGDIFVLHDVIDNVEKEVSATLGILCTIHLDPIVTNDEKLNELKEIAIKACQEIDESITVHDFRAVIGTTHTNLIFDIVLPYESKLTPATAIAIIEEKVARSKENTFCVITVDRG